MNWEFDGQNYSKKGEDMREELEDVLNKISEENCFNYSDEENFIEIRDENGYDLFYAELEKDDEECVKDLVHILKNYDFKEKVSMCGCCEIASLANLDNEGE